MRRCIVGSRFFCADRLMCSVRAIQFIYLNGIALNWASAHKISFGHYAYVVATKKAVMLFASFIVRRA